MTVKEKLSALRAAMQAEQIDAYVVYDSDPHMSEYMPEHYKERRWISGFTGSNGIVVITADRSGLWTDGRYYLQAEQQLAGTEIVLYRTADVGTITVERFLTQQLPAGATVAVNGRICSVDQLSRIQKECGEKGIAVRTDADLIAPLWAADRPALPSAPAFLHSESYAGLSAASKLAKVRELMQKAHVDYYIVGALDSVNWLMNIRGSDVEVSPLFTAFALLGTDTAVLYADAQRLPDDVCDYLAKNGVTLRPYAAIYDDVADLPSRSRVALAGKSVNAAIYDLLGDRVDRVLIDDFCERLKAVKNHTEIHQMRITHRHDGVAMVRFLMWLEQAIKTQRLKEYDIGTKLQELRSKQPGFKGVSFGTIAGYAANGAIVHYAPSPTHSAELAPTSLLLVDSGGQYPGATTDITRTIALGPLTAAQRRDFTLVLQSFIRLQSARFPEGTTGKNLDILARQVMWENDLDYKHGTGHGIGFFLNCHEGPNNFSAATVLEEGMAMSVEPGIYRAGQYGIRTENLVLVVKDRYVDGLGQFYRFEPLTLCPIDVSAIELSMLSKEEIKWLNNYHLGVFEKLSPLLEPDEVKWLAKATQPVHA